MFYQSKTALAVCAAISFSVNAQINSNEQPIERITVTANKFEQVLNHSLATVNIIDRAEIEQSNIRDLPSLLNTVAGVDLVRNGGFGQKADIFVRGATAKHTLVLVNGVRISDANSGAVSFTNIPVNSIERIEVVKGARAAIYGSDAIAGVINIITRQATEHEISITTGSNNYINYQQVGSVSAENIALSFNLGFEETDGYDATQKDPTLPVSKDHDDDGYQSKNLGVNLAYDAADLGVFALVAQYSEGEGEYDNAWGNDAYEFENYTSKLSWSKKVADFAHYASLSFSQEENTQTGTDVQQVYSTERVDLEYRGLYTLSDAVQITAGFNRLTEDLGRASAELSIAERDNQAFFVGGFYQYHKFIANAVVRTDDYEHHGRANTYTTGVGYQFNSQTTFRINHGTAFRAPSLTDAFVKNSPWYLPNEQIKPEEATNNEIGFSLDTGSAQYDVAVFRNKIDNLIANKYDVATKKYIPYNVDSATMEGAEFSANVQAFGMSHNINLTLLDAEDDQGKDLVRRPSETFNYSISKAWDLLDVSLAMQYRSSRPSLALYNAAAGKSEATTLPAFTIFNLSANYEVFNGFKFHARIENLTDKQYITAGTGYTATGEVLGYVPLGRQVYVGGSYRF